MAVDARGLLLCLALPLYAADAGAGRPEFFESKIRPILANNCYACHTNTQMGGLRADSREGLLKGGKTGPSIAPGDPDQSVLIRAVRQTGELKMPQGGKLKPDEIEALVEWVRAFVGYEFAWELELRIKALSAPPAVIGGPERLGWSGWLGSSPTGEPITGMRFEPEHYALIAH